MQNPPLPANINGQALPPTGPTTLSPASLPPNTSPAEPHADRSQPARIRFTEGQLLIAADNTPLHDILDQVARQTGMAIVGNVPDERVFGSYGPGPAADVLSSLLDGTGYNVLLQQDENNRVLQLLIATRNGDLTPPADSAGAGAQGIIDLPPQLALQQNRPRSPYDQGANAAQPNGGNGLSSQQSPNGVKTPQQMYEEMARARRAALLQGAQGFQPGMMQPPGSRPDQPQYPIQPQYPLQPASDPNQQGQPQDGPPQ